MSRKRLLWRLYPSYVVIIFVSLLLVSIHALRSVDRFYRDRLARELQVQAVLVGSRLVDATGALPADHHAVDRLCKDLGRRIPARITVILPDGRVVGDSDKNPAVMDNHGDRPEVREAIQAGVGSVERFSNTLREDMMYVGLPVAVDGRLVAVVRTAVSTASIRDATRDVLHRISVSALLALAFAAAVGLVVSKRITRPLEEMRVGAARFAAGDLQFRLHVPDSVEMAGLAEAMNAMAGELDGRIRTVIQERNERDAVFASMVEGVLAVDVDRRIVHINAAAARLIELGREPETARGRLVEEVVRAADLQRFLSDCLDADEPRQGELSLGQTGATLIRAQGAPLRNADGLRIGALVVLDDVTRVRRLEKIRRDFVANVSHELKTPITSIKGFVETLLDGAAQSPQDLQRFLAIILRQANHLNAIVNDLLSLSRLEHELDGPPVALEPAALSPVLKESVEVCQAKADEKHVTLEVACPSDVRACINTHLLEQAVVNLIDNAVKYTSGGGKVTIEGARAGSGVRIAVRDTGMGIEARHLDRLFERFYRVDTGRSRELGGTGLGLAIVKHIVRVHGGQVGVESVPGRGSVFTITLPSAA